MKLCQVLHKTLSWTHTPGVDSSRLPLSDQFGVCMLCNTMLGLQVVQPIWTSRILIVSSTTFCTFQIPGRFVDAKLNTSITCSCNIPTWWLIISMLLITTTYMFLIYSFIYSVFCIALSNTESNLTSIGIVRLISFILLIESHFSTSGTIKFCPTLWTTCYTLRWKLKLFHNGSVRLLLAGSLIIAPWLVPQPCMCLRLGPID